MSRGLLVGLLILVGLTFCVILSACVAIDFAARRSMDVAIFDGIGGSGGESVEIDSDDPVEVGQALYEANCSGCHTIDGGSRVGPTFQGLYGSDVTMEDGTTVTVDEAHLREAITDPGASIRDGYPSVMPSFDDFSDDEIDALIAFIRSLR